MTRCGHKYAVDLTPSLPVDGRIVLCGVVPFQGQYDFPDPYWSEISDSAKDLVRKLLTVDPRQRYTAAQVLQHPWITGGASSKPLSEGHTQRLMMLQARRRLRKGVQMIIAINKFGQRAPTKQRTLSAQHSHEGATHSRL